MENEKITRFRGYNRMALINEILLLEEKLQRWKDQQFAYEEHQRKLAVSAYGIISD